MTAFKGTPAPWSNLSVDGTQVFGGPDDQLVAQCWSADDACLIATSPVLLEVLTDCVAPLLDASFRYLIDRHDDEARKLFSLLDNTNMVVWQAIADALGTTLEEMAAKVQS